MGPSSGRYKRTKPGRLEASQSVKVPYFTSLGTQKVSGRKSLYTISIVTSNLNSLRSSPIAIGNKTFLRIMLGRLFLVGNYIRFCNNIIIGGILKFNCIPLLRSWELSGHLCVENEVLTVFSGSTNSLYFCGFL